MFLVILHTNMNEHTRSLSPPPPPPPLVTTTSMLAASLCLQLPYSIMHITFSLHPLPPTNNNNSILTSVSPSSPPLPVTTTTATHLLVTVCCNDFHAKGSWAFSSKVFTSNVLFAWHAANDNVNACTVTLNLTSVCIVAHGTNKPWRIRGWGESPESDRSSVLPTGNMYPLSNMPDVKQNKSSSALFYIHTES